MLHIINTEIAQEYGLIVKTTVQYTHTQSEREG